MLLRDTFTYGVVKYTMTSMNVLEPVMSLAIQLVSKDSGGQVSGFPLNVFIRVSDYLVILQSLPSI